MNKSTAHPDLQSRISAVPVADLKKLARLCQCTDRTLRNVKAGHTMHLSTAQRIELGLAKYEKQLAEQAAK